jgi:hypothetical protein
MPVIPAFGRWRRENHKFQVSLDYRARAFVKKPKLSKQIKKIWELRVRGSRKKISTILNIM